jgi:hypothetical protein
LPGCTCLDAEQKQWTQPLATGKPTNGERPDRIRRQTVDTVVRRREANQRRKPRPDLQEEETRMSETQPTNAQCLRRTEGCVPHPSAATNDGRPRIGARHRRNPRPGPKGSNGGGVPPSKSCEEEGEEPMSGNEKKPTMRKREGEEEAEHRTDEPSTEEQSRDAAGSVQRRASSCTRWPRCHTPCGPSDVVATAMGSRGARRAAGRTVRGATQWTAAASTAMRRGPTR